MKSIITKDILLFTLTLALAVSSSFALPTFDLIFKSGNKQVEKQDLATQYHELSRNEYVIISFTELPDQLMKESLRQAGIHLEFYLPRNSFYARISSSISMIQLKTFNFFAVNSIWSDSKFHPLLNASIPEWALIDNKVSLILSYMGEFSEEQLKSIFSSMDVEMHNMEALSKRAFVFTSPALMEAISALDFVYFIEPVDPPSFPENYGGRAQHRSNMLAQDFASGTKYDGTGVNVGMHDDGIIGPHIDYEGRLPIQFPTNNSGDHGDHVAGTIMGAGNLDPKGRGMAFGANLYVYTSANNNYDSAVSHYNTYNVVITSKSYSNGCNAGYTTLSRQLDQQIRMYPSLIHVFSAGNAGTSDCSYGAGSGWANITGGHKMGKNVIATGNLTSNDLLATSSSRGPASDGRIKPDICAKGTSVYSTIDENDYGLKTGTSMACPGISGSLAQLYHAYKSLNSNQNPKSGLIKGTVLNTADDLGNPGPDYKYGWGRINLRRALDVLENNQFITASIGSSGSNSHSVMVPANVKEVRIMLYWHDYEAVASAARAIVNNLDMTVTDPFSNVYYPWVLNPTPVAAALDSNAKRAIDSLNNMEQVTIDNPAQGTYTVSVNPTAVPQGPQEYFVIYEFIYDEVYLTYPNGGEGLVPGETETIRWDAYGNSSSFDLAYSANNGASWTNIALGISGSLRQLNWNIPNNVSDSVKVRISRGLISDESDAFFNIIGVPSNLQVDWICTDSLKLSWNNVASATNYRTYMLGNKYMDSMATTSTNSYIFHNTNPGDQYWLSVSANPSFGETGRRAVAIQTSLGIANCPLKSDASLAQISSPTAGTYLSCVLDNIDLSVYVKNDGIDTISNVAVGCRISPTNTQTNTYAGQIMPGDSVLVTMPNKINLSDTYLKISCYTVYSGDKNTYNDSSEVSLVYKPGNSVSTSWREDFESFFVCGTNTDCGATICNLYNGWINDSTNTLDDHDWRTDNGGTASGQTGPSFDHNPGTASGNYLYTEASAGCSYKKAQMMTPCLDLTNTSKPHLTFWYHMYGLEMGELHVDLLTENGYVLDVITRHQGNLGDVWLADSLDLEPYKGGVVSVRFRGITGWDYRSDMAIDDIELKETDPYFSVNENQKKIDIHLYPNPSKGLFYLDKAGFFGKNIKLAITDLSGKKISANTRLSEQRNRFEIDINQLPEGLYMLLIEVEGQTYTKKLVKF